MVRVNHRTTHWSYWDVVTVTEGAGANLDCIMLPKVQDAGQVVALDLLLTQIEKTVGLPVGRIGIEAQIENAMGLVNVDAIAAASPRLETIIFGPADFMASINMKSLVVGEQPPGYPADAYHYILMRILIAARAHDLQAIDGPYLQIRNADGYGAVARRAAALGFDGKWVLHPDQIAAANEIFSPSQEDYDHAELILDAYDWCTSEAGGAKGSAMLGEEMIDEASRKMALVIAGKGRAGRHAAHLYIRATPGVSEMQFGRTYEEFEVGAVYKHWPGKTVTEYDDHLFCLLTMNHHPLHLDAHYAGLATGFGRNVVVGNYIYSLLLGMSVPDVSGQAIANLEVESLKHVAPTFHGDTIYGQTTVLGKRLTSAGDRGIVQVETRGYNQDGTVVCVFRRKVMVPTEAYIKERGGEQPGRPEPDTGSS